MFEITFWPYHSHFIVENMLLALFGFRLLREYFFSALINFEYKKYDLALFQLILLSDDILALFSIDCEFKI